MKTIVFCICFLFTSTLTLAQQATFKGKISAEGKPENIKEMTNWIMKSWNPEK